MHFKSRLQILPLKSITEHPRKACCLVPITNTPTTLAEALTQSGLSVEGNNIIRINLLRDSQTYVFTLDGLLNSNSPKAYLQPGDRVTIEIFTL